MFSANDARALLNEANLALIIKPITEEVKKHVEENAKRSLTNRLDNKIIYEIYPRTLAKAEVPMPRVLDALKKLGYEVESDLFTNNQCFSIKISW